MPKALEFDGRAPLTAPRESWVHCLRMARETFNQARDRILDCLERRGWSVARWGPSGTLKVPHATDPSGRLRLWFKAQSVYYAINSRNLGDARSLWTDLRSTTGEDFERMALRELDR